MQASLQDKLKKWAANGHLLWAATETFALSETPEQLLRLINELSCGESSSLPTVELLDGRIMGGLRGAYTHSDPAGSEKIYLNLDWIEVADTDQIEAVLLEEIGHALDFRINGTIDTAGDEGAVFSALIRNDIPASNERTQNDHHIIRIDGVDTAVEASSPAPVLVKDIRPGTDSSSPNYLTVFNNKLYFRATDTSNGTELWQSDGTASGTTLLKDILTGASSSYPSDLTVFNNKLYFTASNGSNGTELWQSDGTALGTTLLKDIRTGSASSHPNNLFANNNKLYFSAYDDTNGAELWQSDGTESGTTIVKDINPGSSSSSPWDLQTLGNNFLFTAYNDNSNESIWKSNGTFDGTTQVIEFTDGGGEGSVGSIIFDGKYLTSQYNNTNGHELWESDGTASGTKLRADIFEGSDSSNPGGFTIFNEKLFFRARNGTSGYELWSMEATPAPAPTPTPTPTPDPYPTPTLIAPVAGSITEVDNSSKTTSSGLSGTLSAFDRDGTGFSYAMNGGTTNGEITTLAASYGSFSLNTSTGAYTYTPKDSAIEAIAAGENVVDSFAVSASRGSGRPTATSTYNVNINGANDAPSLKSPTAGSISEDSNASSFSSSALSGTLSAADIDGDSLSYAISGGTSSGKTSIKEGSYGSLSLNSTSGLYTYTPDSTAINALKGGETATDSFTLSVSDGILSTSTSYSVNLSGADEIIPINQSDSVTGKKDKDSNVYSRKGKNIMRGSPGATNFIFSNKEALTKDNADVIVDFKKTEGDQIQIDGNLHGLPDDPKFKRTRNRRKLSRFARSNVDLVYFKRRHLYINANGKENGFGDDNEDSLLAILKGKPRLSEDSFEMI